MATQLSGWVVRFCILRKLIFMRTLLNAYARTSDSIGLLLHEAVHISRMHLAMVPPDKDATLTSVR